ncbi:Slc38a11 [Symbiodinium pilosum]|uniref:ER membrane protein complex subunit 4 n=1 Tax=Symbiodinium pilosum TaxID=2952 RepID=A0A812M1E5_SYMPI|nr:Slc38a11 [Symbiodinium pilosum]
MQAARPAMFWDAALLSSRSRKVLGCHRFRTQLRRCAVGLILAISLQHLQAETFSAPGQGAPVNALLDRKRDLNHVFKPRQIYTRTSRGASESIAEVQEVKLSSVTQSTVNLVKNIVGAGMLSLPHGVAAFSASSEAVVPSLILTFLAAVFSAYGFVLIAQACEATGESTYTRVWARSVSESTKMLPAAACLAKAAIGCISFSMILGDCISLMLAPMNLPTVVASRDAVIFLITATVLFPLCSMKSLAPLAKFSLLGVLSNFYICTFVVLRCVDGSYRKGSALLAAAPAAPKFTAASGAWQTMMSPGLSVLLSILATAFLAHYNAPLFLEQLAPDPKTGKKDKRFVIMSVLGFCTAGLIFSLVMVGGFLTFGSSCMGLILNNYAATDSLALFARAAIVLSLVTAYPLVFFSLRKQVLEILGSQGADMAEKRPRAMTVVLLAGVTAVALKLRNLGVVAALAGASLGTFLVYVAPALMVMGAQRRGLAARPEAKSAQHEHGNCVRSLVQQDKTAAAQQVDGIQDPIGYKLTMDDSGSAAGKNKSKTANQELLEKKAWEVAVAPIQSVGMNLFMLWMSGSSPGIFTVMILGYCLTSIVGQFTKANAAFQNFKTIDTTLQWLAYLALCSVSLAYLLYHMAGMGLLPNSSGDWIALIPNVEVVETAGGVLK